MNKQKVKSKTPDSEWNSHFCEAKSWVRNQSRGKQSNLQGKLLVQSDLIGMQKGK